MRILQMHSDWIEYQPIEKEIAQAEIAEKKKYRLEDILVLFTAVEKTDNESVGRKAISEVKGFLENIKLNRILIYPFAHLSSNLASPNDALKVIKAMEEDAKKLKIETYRAPFGWNKKFSISIKGHPLAEQLKTFGAENEEKGKGVEEETEALEAEKKVKSTWFILETTGKLTPVDKFNFTKYRNLEKFKNYEIAKSRTVQQIPPHVTLMKKLEIADYEPGSDSGNLRFYPKGRLIKSLLEEFVTRLAVDNGAVEVETPIMYDYTHPAFASYLNRFPARHYVIKSDDKDFFLRFSACFGEFLITKDAQISYKHLPFKMYELTRYSFRREKSGELVGLKRLRAFTMPDMHTLCRNLEDAKKEYSAQFKLCLSCLKEIGFDVEDFETAIRFTEDFWKQNKDFIVSLVKIVKTPVLIEMWNYRYAYFDPKFEFNFVDTLDKASALSTVQIDYENAERYGISYTDEDGKKKYPLILHCSPSGAIERDIYALLEKAYLDQQNKKVPQLPLWLSPTQVRLIPLSEKFVQATKKIADEIEKENIRVDVDDRSDTVQKKIRDAELEWINYILVFGPKEIKSKKLSVRDRKTGKIKEMKLEQLIKEIKEEIKDKPFKKLSLSKLLSVRPIFVG
jgi:threonyl-tRNA synthetase